MYKLICKLLPNSIINSIIEDHNLNPYRKMWHTLKTQSGYRRTVGVEHHHGADNITSISDLMAKLEDVSGYKTYSR